jgi:hypothetical protein
LVATKLITEMLGYGGTVPLPGFGVFSMNLLSPFYPGSSALLPSFGLSPDATGGQSEGYNYLGLGVLFLLVCCVLLHAARRRFPTFLRMHAGLVSVCFGLTLLAMSNRGYAGYYEIYDFGPFPSLIGQFRASGRFFWPVGYAIIISTVLMIARLRRPALGATALIVAAGLQFADARLFREANYNSMHTRPEWSINTAQLRPLLASHEQLNIFPIVGCGVDAGSPGLMQLLLLASEYNIPVNTMYIARMTNAPPCDQASMDPLQEGELRILLRRASVVASEDSRSCRMLNQDMAVCSRNTQFLVSLPEVPPVTMPVGRRIETQSGGRQDLMTVGWSISETGGTWTEGNTAILTGRLAEPLQDGSELLVWCHSLTLNPGGKQQVTVFANDKQIGVWSVPEGHDVVKHAILPFDLGIGQKLTIRFEIGQTVRPIDRKINSDDRQLGLWLSAFELQPVPTVALVRKAR